MLEVSEFRDTGLADLKNEAIFEYDTVKFDVLGDDYFSPEYNQEGVVLIDDKIWFGEWDAKYCINIKKL